MRGSSSTGSMGYSVAPASTPESASLALTRRGERRHASDPFDPDFDFFGVEEEKESSDMVPDAPFNVAVIGTGEKARNLALLWALAGHSVVIGAADAAQAGHAAAEVRLAAHTYIGGLSVPDSWVRGEALRAACVESSIIALLVDYPQAHDVIKHIAPDLYGMGKVFVDATNPYVYPGTGMPPGCRFHSAAELHRHQLNDPTAQWCIAYKDIAADDLVPTRKGVLVTIAGNRGARALISKLVLSHGFTPAEEGGLENAARFEPGRRVETKPKDAHERRRRGSTASRASDARRDTSASPARQTGR